MTSVSALVDTVALLLFQNLREGMETGRIDNVNTAQAEVEAAIAELNRRRLAEEHNTPNDLVGKMVLEIGSLHEKVAQCEARLVEFQCQAKALREDTAQIAARTEACNLLVEQQRKENTKFLDTVEEIKVGMSTASPPCVAPAPSPIDPVSHPAPSKVALVSFPGGPRTITIHPPNSPNYKSIVREEKGDVIIDFRRTKPLRREGAFRGPLEDIDWFEITRTCGRGPDTPGVRTLPPVPCWPDRSQPPSCPPPSRGPSDLIARQRQLSTSVQTDLFGRALAPGPPSKAKSPSLPTGASSSSHGSSHDPCSSPSAKLAGISTPSSTPPSPSIGRGKKRARNSDGDEDVLLTAEMRGEAPLLTGLQTVREPTTPTPIKCEESHPPEGPSKRKRLRSSASSEGLSSGHPTRMT